VLLLWLFGLPPTVLAQMDIVEFENSRQRELYQKVIKELRCLVCQNQNLADSNADLARDLKRKTHEMIQQGKEYDDIIQYMLERYGEFVLYRPRVTPSTMMLWFSPFVLLVAVFTYALIRIRKSRQPTYAVFTKEELNNAKTLLDRNSSP
jgi:cytochrome c-type biogenesis protein CcmH